MMESMRESWTDKRLDERFNGIDQRLDSLERRMEAGFARVDADIRELRVQMAAMQRTMAQGFIALSTVMVAGFGGMAGLLVTL